jgi:hypothetical protein
MGTAGWPCSSSSACFHASQNGSTAGGSDSPKGSSYFPAATRGTTYPVVCECQAGKLRELHTGAAEPPLPAFLSSLSATC